MRPALLALFLTATGCGAPAAPQTPSVHGCSGSGWVDKTADSADRRIGFGGELGSSAVGYAPPCMIVSAGQTVTFVGNYGTHPLAPGEQSGADAGTTPNPIPSKTTGAGDTPVTFDRAGVYPYYCVLHAPTMVGAVWVK